MVDPLPQLPVLRAQCIDLGRGLRQHRIVLCREKISRYRVPANCSAVRASGLLSRPDAAIVSRRSTRIALTCSPARSRAACA
jgi:hypothetical protein